MWENLHVSQVSRVFLAHAESAEFAEAHIASLVLAMRDILQCPPESGGREPQARRGYANGEPIVCDCLKYDYSNIVVETYPFPALRRYFPWLRGRVQIVLELQNIQILRLLRFSREINIRVDMRDTPEPNIIREIRVFKKPNPFSKKV